MAAGLAAVALMAAACGGDDSGGAQAAPDDPPVTNADLGGQRDGPDGEMTPSELEEEAVTDAYHAARHARVESAAPPTPDPELPALAETHSDPSLSEWQDQLVGMGSQGNALRYPDDSEAEVVDLEMQFSWWVDEETSAGGDDLGADEVGDKATLDVCILDDGEIYDVATGAVEWGGLYTFEETAVMRKLDGEWMMVEYEASRREGRAGCALG